MNDPRGFFNDEEIIQTNYAGESDAKLVGAATLPMMLSDERSKSDCDQQNHEWQRHPPVRPCRDETQDQNHLAIGLIAVRSVNETRLCGACFEEWFEDSEPRVDQLQDVCGTARKCATTSISAVCGNMSSGVTELIANLCCNSFRSRARVGGLHDT